MAESYITRKGGGGAAVNGLIESYKVKAGETISAGDFVDFVNQEVGATVGSSHVFQSNVIQSFTGLISGTLVEEDKVLITYYDESVSDRGVAVVIKITGSTISSGTPFNFNGNATTYFSQVTLINTNKVLIVYRNAANSNYGTAKILTINDTTITGSSAVVFESTTLGDTSLLFLETNKALIAYRANNATGIVKVLTISGDNISVGNATQFNSSQPYEISLSYIRTNKALVAYSDGGNSFFGTVKIITINNTTTSVGSSFVFNSANSGSINNVLVETGKVALVFKNGPTQKNISLILNISTSDVITAGNPLVLGTVQYIYATLVETNQILIIYQDMDNGFFGSYRILTVNGNTLTSTNSAFFNNGIVGSVGAIKTSNNKAIIYYRNHANSFYGTATLLNLPYLEKAMLPAVDQIFGVAKTAGTGGQTIDVYVDETAGPIETIEDFIQESLKSFTVASGQTITAGTFVDYVQGSTFGTTEDASSSVSGYAINEATLLNDNTAMLVYRKDTTPNQNAIYCVVVSFDSNGQHATSPPSLITTFTNAQAFPNIFRLNNNQAIVLLANTNGNALAYLVTYSGALYSQTVTVQSDAIISNYIDSFPMSGTRLTDNKAIISYRDSSSSPNLIQRVRVVNISGGTMTLGNPTNVTSFAVHHYLRNITRINDTEAFVHAKASNDNFGYVYRISVGSGDAITVTYLANISTNASDGNRQGSFARGTSIEYIPSENAAIVVWSNSDSNGIRARLVSYSGTVSSIIQIESPSSTNPPVICRYSNNQVMITYPSGGVSYYRILTINPGLSLSFTGLTSFPSLSTTLFTNILTSTDNTIAFFGMGGNTFTQRIGRMDRSKLITNTTAEKVFGLAKTGGTAGQTIEVYTNT